MGKRIFVSRADADEQLVSLFIDQILCKGLGVCREDILCTSPNVPASLEIDRIKTCDLFIMMVSDHFRRNEFCMNEMGAAWACNSLSRVVMLVEEVPFDEVGWLTDLKKNSYLCSDSIGLDSFYDFVVNLFSARSQTATWNMSKNAFFQLMPASNDGSSDVDLLDLREHFDNCSKEVSRYMNVLSDSTRQYGEHLIALTQSLNQISTNPKAFNSSQIRNIFEEGSRHTDDLTLIFEQYSPLLKESFSTMMDYGIKLQISSSVSDEVKKMNRLQSHALFKAIMEAREEMLGFRLELNQIIDIDKTFKKSNNRLKLACDQLIEVLVFCINQTVKYQLS